MIDGQGAPWWMAGSLVAGAIVMKAVDWLLARRKNRTETDANVELINQLREGMDRMNKRMLAMEEVQDRLAHRLEEEIQARQAAQEEAHRLKMRVQTLEAEMRRLGVVIPPDHTKGAG